MRNKVSQKVSKHPARDWYKHPDVNRIKLKGKIKTDRSNNVKRECIAVMKANGGAPHYM